MSIGLATKGVIITADSKFPEGYIAGTIEVKAMSETTKFEIDNNETIITVNNNDIKVGIDYENDQVTITDNSAEVSNDN